MWYYGLPMSTKTIRRSVLLPTQLVEDATAVAPEPLRGNLNRLVVTALRQYVAIEKQKAFEAAMRAMAADPAIQSECVAIAGEFAPADSDGLPR